MLCFLFIISYTIYIFYAVYSMPLILSSPVYLLQYFNRKTFYGPFVMLWVSIIVELRDWQTGLLVSLKKKRFVRILFVFGLQLYLFVPFGLFISYYIFVITLIILRPTIGQVFSCKLVSEWKSMTHKKLKYI